ncbi:MAG TPA: hypothetical protein VE890_00405 [Thermoguttaceae bacterium]|nr:hypothetical protein [Thermoguttaceae bacterium]
MNRSNEGELPIELKAFEARLAALQPRSDRLDRDALLFEAGRASTQSGLWRRWAWPSAFGAMTTVAAALLAFVLLRAEPEPIVEYVYIERPADSKPTPDESIPKTVEDAQPQKTLPVAKPHQSPRTEPSDRRPPRSTMMAAIGRNWLGVDSLGSSPRQRQLESLLAHGSDTIRRPNVSPEDDLDSGHRYEPQPYWQLREMLLEGTNIDDPSAAPAPEPPLENGAHS